MPGQRKLFEEVTSPNRTHSSPSSGPTVVPPSVSRRGIRVFLTVLFGLVVGMILVGGITRHTDSGLAITVWEPISGAVPPLNDQDWNAEFEKYKTTPEFNIVNYNMQLSDFKTIFWWEWGHRQLGRTVGVVFLAGFVWLYFTGQIDRVWSQRLIALGGLGLFQGLVGWWMVSSGLQNQMTDVASYRLATHLTISFAILVLIYWNILRTRHEGHELLQARRGREQKLERVSLVILTMLFVQGILGALMAGIDAGLGFPTWPLMNGEFVPDNSLDYTPWYVNFVENPSLVHFNHRIVGYLLVIASLWAWYLARKSPHQAAKRMGYWGMLAMLIQAGLGVSTALASVPVELAILHQLWAVLVIIVYVRFLFESRYPKLHSIRG